MPTLNSVVLIGATELARPLLRAYVRHENVGDVILVDPDPQARAALMADFGIIKHETDDLASALKLARPQWADLCCPAAQRLAYLRQVTEAELDAILERPLAPTAQECDEIIALAEASGRRVMACVPQWFLPAHQRMGGLLTSGEIGEKLAGTVIASGGGADPWQVAHEAITFVQHFLGATEAVYASLSAHGDGEAAERAPATLLLQLELAAGRRASITICSQPALSMWAEERRVLGTEGMLLVRDNPEDEMPLVLFAGADFRPIRVAGPPEVRKWAAREAVLRLADALIAGEPAPVTLEDAREVVAVWEAAQLSAATQARVALG
jgi:predicted dehydrogenase